MDFKKLAKKIKLDFEVYNTKPIIAKQLDNKSRYIEFTLYNNGELFPIDDTMRFSIYAKKPNGDEVWNSCEVIDRSKSKILFELSDCLIAEEGTINAELLVRSEDKVLTSREITIQALKCFHSENSLATSREYNELTQMIKELNDAKETFVRKNGDTMTGSLNIVANGSNLSMGAGRSDVFLANLYTDKYLQLTNDGVLSYSDERIYHEGFKQNELPCASPKRPVSANIPVTGDGALRHYKATSTMTEDKPTAGDGHILNFDWDTDAGYNTQLFIKNGNSPRIQYRSQSSGTWNNWETVYSTNNKPTPADIGALPISGGTMTGDIQMNGNSIGLSNDFPNAKIGIEPTTQDVYISNVNGSWLRIKPDRSLTIGGKKVYTELEKPTCDEVGALAKTGGRVTGDIVLTSGKAIYFNSTDEYNLWNIKHDGKDLLIHNGNRNAFRFKDDCTLAFGGMKVYMDKDGERPTPAEIGALASNGNAVSASKLATARTIRLTGDVTGSITFDGSKNVEIATKITRSAFKDGDTKNYIWSDDGAIQYFNVGNSNGGYLHVGTVGHGAKGVDWWTSDLKLKENVESLRNKAMTVEETADDSKPIGLDLVDKMELFSYYHKEEQQQIDVGFIANQLEELDERLVIKVEQTEDSPYYSEEDKYLRQPKVSAIIPHLTLAIQQLNNKLNGLQAENIQLKKELSELKK